MKLIWIFITIGGGIGGYLPVLFGDSGFGGWSILGTLIGSFIGIWVWKRLDLEG
jgi:hypothetical protein